MIYLIGAGPGSADLLTLKAARILGQTDAVIYDRLVSEEVLSIIRPGAELIFAGKEEGRQEAIQDEILRTMERCARKHKTVVRLKGGDPFVFGRGAEEWAWLVERGWEVEVVPGVSSSLAVPALAGVPATYRGIAQGFAVVTGHVREGLPAYWAKYAQVDTLVVLMGVKHRAAIADALLAAGRPAGEPVCFIENGTTSQERFVRATLREVAAGEVVVASPAVWVIGEVVRVREWLRTAATAAA